MAGAAPVRAEGEEECEPVTELGLVVQNKEIKSLDEIYLKSTPIEEPEIVDYFIGSELKDEVRTKWHL
jgi:small subunit ribosomal protein S2e